MEILKKIFNWFIYSSASANKFALTLKGAIPLLVLIGVGDAVSLEGALGAFEHFLVTTGIWLSSAATLYGFLRKLFITSGLKNVVTRFIED